MDTVLGLHTANDVWKKLKTTYSPSATPTTTTTSNKENRLLYGAILNGDWEKAREFFNEKDAWTAKINDDNESPLHVAIGTCKNIEFLENLLKEIDRESLPKLVTNRKLNVLHRAALVGNTKAAEMLVEKNPLLLFIVDNQKYLPIHRAIFGSHENTFLYLLDATKQHIRVISQQDGYQSPFEGVNSVVLLTNVIAEGLLDVAYELIKEYPYMARTKKGNSTALKAIAKLDAYYSGTRYNFYQRFIYSYVLKENNIDNAYEIQDIESQDPDKAKFVANCSRSCFHSVVRMIHVKFLKVALLHVPHIKHLHEEKVKHNKVVMVLKCICEEVGKIDEVGDHICEHYHEAMTLALENDIPEAIEEIITSFPEAIWTKHNDYYLTQFAIINRCEKVYNFLVHDHEVVIDKHLHKVRIDKDGNNLLHLAGHLAPIAKLNLVSGAALQMQRELQWFEQVKKFVLHRHNRTKNKNQETPIMVFRREHKDLRKEGEEWMKKTADSYTITAALIITIVFAAAITVPGGNDGNTGKAIFANKSSFIIFAVSDAISLFASTTSLLLFLSILTARYRDEDFLYRLPKRLILGLAMLFLSVTSMMVAFSATLYIMFGQEKKWILIPIAALTCLPIASFVTLQLPLLVDLISSTYGHGIFGKQSDHGRIK
ncbi:hypothetical protein L6452_30672 [Arctium lappa]|uniref:Uncharacterized protein n=1 Tax=Arctium lappa TaxID=4217 RepID=A0ACB8ZIQ4_ARCLA|nr:hypothetical protein L6452_30672 [Arctium lappa]